MKARFIREIGVRVSLGVYWGADCPDAYGPGHPGIHDAAVRLEDRLGPPPEILRVEADDDPRAYTDDRWPTRCDRCGAAVPPDGHRVTEPYDEHGRMRPGAAIRQVFQARLYDSPSGRPEPGDLFWVPCMARLHGAPALCPWDNCEGRHLHAILPNGHTWDLDSRASNCTRREDRTHRCWVRHGSPPDVHVDKAGHTCAAGAGSIAVPGYHGFLHHGAFAP